MGLTSRPSTWGMAERRRKSRTMLFGFSADSEVSIRNRSAQATSGRNTKKLVPTTRITIVTIAMATFEYEPGGSGAHVAADAGQALSEALASHEHGHGLG